MDIYGHIDIETYMDIWTYAYMDIEKYLVTLVREGIFYVLNHVEISLGNNGMYMQFVYHHYLKRHVFKNNQQNAFYKYTSVHP